MSQERASIFGSDEGTADFDVSGFAPKKPEIKQRTVPVEALRAVAESAKFPSRESTQPVIKPSAPVTREIRRHRTGRNTQLNLKVKPETVDAFYKIADAHGWVLGEAFEEAVTALTEKLVATK